MSPDDFDSDAFERADDHDRTAEHGAIGVGMGGSCPTCKAPVDLGQEFCLECGSPIRFTPRQQRRGERRTTTTTAPAGPPPRSGFPWVPFLVILALIGGVVAFAMVGGQDDDGDRGRDETEEALPTITNDAPDTTSSTETTTVESCTDAGAGLDGTEPAVTDADPNDGFIPGGNATDGSSEQIPDLDDGSTDQTDEVPGFSSPDTPSTTPEAITVDRDGNYCAPSDTGGGTADDGSLDDPGGAPLGEDPLDTTPGGQATTPANPTTTDTTTTDGGTADAGTTGSDGEWPGGRSGWTVIVAGYETSTAGAQSRAERRAAKVQGDGFSDGGVLLTDDYPSLCPGFYVVFSGVFESEAQAEQRFDELSALPNYAGKYVRQIRTGGQPSDGCTS